MREPGVQTIRVLSPTHVRVIRNGHQERVAGVRFESDQQVRELVRRVAAAAGRLFDAARPRVDVTLDDGSRLHAVMPPLSRQYTQVTIRRFTLFDQRLDSLVQQRALPRSVARLLVAAVKARINILIAGDGGAGKTTLQRMLLLEVDDPEEWLIVLESTFELGLDLLMSNCQVWQARTANGENVGEITLRQLLEEDALRCEPTRVCVGECRAGESATLLEALNAGHRGTVTTIHAPSAEDALERLLTAAELADRAPSEHVLRRMIASNIDMIVYVEKRGQRRIVSQVVEVDHRLGVDDQFGTRSLWLDDGQQLVRTGHPSRLVERIRAAGVPYVEDEAA
jgi:pilus assembly protein CpaF